MSPEPPTVPAPPAPAHIDGMEENAQTGPEKKRREWVKADHDGTGMGRLLGWAGGDLAVRDDQALGQLDRPRMSPSTMNAMVDGCPASWAAKSLMPRDHGGPFAPNHLGSGAHEVHEELFNLPAPQRSRTALLNLVTQVAEKTLPGEGAEIEAKRAEWSAKVIPLILPILDCEDPTQVQVFSTEELLNGSTVRGIPVSGRIDLVREDPEGFRIADLKTGKVHTAAEVARYKRDPEGHQQRLYAAAFEDKHGVMPVGGYLLYSTAPKRSMVRTVPWSKRQHASTLDRFERSWAELKTYAAARTFPTRPIGSSGNPNALCGWCVLREACPVRVAQDTKNNWPEMPTRAALDMEVVDEVSPLALSPTPSSQPETYPVRPVDAPAHLSGDAPAADTSPQENPMTNTNPTPLPTQPPAGQDAPAPVGQVPQTPMGLYAYHGYTHTEGKPWQSCTTPEALDPADAATKALSGFENYAYERLVADRMALTPQTIGTLASILSVIAANVEMAAHPQGATGFDRAANTLARAAVYTVVKARLLDGEYDLPIPYEGGTQAMARWAHDVARRATVLVQAPVHLRHLTPSSTPWNDPVVWVRPTTRPDAA